MSDETTTESPTLSDKNQSNAAEAFTATTFSQLVRDHQNAYIRVADNKASILLSGLIAYLGLSLSVIGANIGTEGAFFPVFASISVFSSIIGIYYAASAVYPDTPSTQQGLIMWESIIEKSEEEYRRAIRSQNSGELLDELIDENYQLAKVNDIKYQQVRRTLQATVPTIVFGILAMLSLVL